LFLFQAVSFMAPRTFQQTIKSLHIGRVMMATHYLTSINIQPPLLRDYVIREAGHRRHLMSSLPTHTIANIKFLIAFAIASSFSANISSCKSFPVDTCNKLPLIFLFGYCFPILSLITVFFWIFPLWPICLLGPSHPKSCRKLALL